MKTAKYSIEDICAIIVSFNPNELLINNINALKPQVAKCVVVDNGSIETNVLGTVRQFGDVHIIELGENKGIAAALNVGLRYCEANGYKLILTMDQDTILKERTVDELLKPINEGIAESTGINWDNQAKEDALVDYLITSGNLLVVEAAKDIDMYDEALFIDSVDFDLCLRLQENGYRLCKVSKANAIHNLGDENGSSKYRTHSTQRYYYIARNHFYLIRKYKKKHRLFCIKKQLAFIWDLVQLAMYDKDRKQKYDAIKHGYKDSKSM